MPDPVSALEPQQHLDANQYVFSGSISSVQKGTVNSSDYHVHNITIDNWYQGRVDAPIQLLSDSTWGPLYKEGTEALFIFNEKLTETDFNATYFNNDYLQFQLALCPAANLEIVVSDDAEYDDYRVVLESFSELEPSTPENPTSTLPESSFSISNVPVITGAVIISGLIGFILAMFLNSKSDKNTKKAKKKQN